MISFMTFKLATLIHIQLNQLFKDNQFLFKLRNSYNDTHSNELVFQWTFHFFCNVQNCYSHTCSNNLVFQGWLGFFCNVENSYTDTQSVKLIIQWYSVPFVIFEIATLIHIQTFKWTSFSIIIWFLLWLLK